MGNRKRKISHMTKSNAQFFVLCVDINAKRLMIGQIYLLQRFYDHDTSPKTLNRANSVNKTIDADELKAAWTNNFGIIILGKKLNEFSQILG